MNRDRLASVMRIRQIQERSARGALAVTRQELRAAAAAERRTWDTLDERRGDGCGVLPARGLHALQGAVAAGVLAAGTQHQLTCNAETAADLAVVDWTLAARRVEGLERLAERQRLIEQEEAVRRSANEIDDLVLVRFTGDHV